MPKRAEKIKDQPISPYRLAQAKQLWILDFHSSISNSQVNLLQNYAKEFGTRIIWANKTTKPQPAINALMNYGIKQCNLDLKSYTKTASALTIHPTLNNSIDLTANIDKTDWQTNTANTLIHWLQAKYQQHNAVFSLKDLQLELFSLGLTVPKEILQAQLDLALQQQSLIKVNEQLVTTKNMVALEQACLDLVAQNKNIIPKMVESEKITISSHLTNGQQAAIKLALTTGDRVVGIQGIAGSGKTTMLRSLNQLCKDAGFEIIGLTVTTSAKERLQIGSQNLISKDPLLQAGIKTFTVRKFLIESEKLLINDPTLAKLEYGSNKLLILDEASFVSTAEMFAVVSKVVELNARLIIMGDHRQLSSVEAGKIFYLMLGSNMQSVIMTENVRFKSAKALTVMQHIYQNQIPEALQKLGNSLVEIPDHQERLMKMAELYLQKTPDARKNTLLITPEHADRKLVNQEIRQGLKVSGELTGIEINCHNLTQVKLTKAEQQKIYYFKEEDLVVFFKTPSALKVQINQYYRITNKNLEEGILTLEHQITHEQIIWSPERQASNINIYRQEQRGLMINDQIRWSKNYEAIGVYNGQTAVVIAVNENNNATVLLPNGKEILLDLQQLINQHWDYAYAATTFVAQGADQITTIALAKGGYSREITTNEIKIGDVLMTKETSTDLSKDQIKAKLVKVLAINKDHTAVVQDRLGNTLIVDLKQSPTDSYFKNQAIWHSYPDPKNRKSSAIPKLTSISEFLVSVTRGDQVIILVDHIESYQHALEQRVYGARSALEFLDPNKDKVRAKVDSMTKNITGKALTKTTNNEQLTLPTQNSLYKNSKVTIEQVIDKLHANILKYVTEWLGQPQKINNKEARWGKKGSLVVTLSGAKAGNWYDFEAGKGGKNLLSLYLERFNHDFKTAISELSSALHINSEYKLFNKTSTNINQTTKNFTTLDIKKIKYINKVYASGVLIYGTLAEKYLREFRGVNGIIPDDFRFCAKLKHPDLGTMVPALLAPIKNEQGILQGIVRVFLNTDGNKLNTTYIDHKGIKQPATVKANLGSMANAAVIVNQGSNSNTIYIAEGIETALSVAQAKPLNRVVAALSVSNLKTVPLPLETKTVILCSDYVGVNAVSNKALMLAAKFYMERGLEVMIAYPEKIPGMKKIDFNDVLRHLGVDSINKSLQHPIPQKLPEATKTNITPLNKTIETNDRTKGII